jgi:NAD(P)-dependent dehydrogenase (short-subunit alcohol dehydrogenase family)
MKNIEYYIIIGSSRGLGAAIVDELLKDNRSKVIGISRTPYENIINHTYWQASHRYQHVEMDITQSSSSVILKNISSNLPLKQPVCVIFNAAIVASDIDQDSQINYEQFENINKVGIDGFGNVLKACEQILLDTKGVFVGISSFGAFVPPVFDPRIAYPASKAYLNMALRCLRTTWDKIDIITINLGHIGGKKTGFFSQWISPSYTKTARKIIKIIKAKKIPQTVNYPFIYQIVYGFILGFIPDALYQRIFTGLKKWMSAEKI